MRYLPHTNEDVREMLHAVGVETLEELFAAIPEPCRRRDEMDLPPALSEWELCRLMEDRAGGTAAAPQYTSFLGAGSYDHFIPDVIPSLLNRSEFSTSYTPYQPELSQGTLQAIYEYQTLAARLTGMEIANASLYDGASAFAEALLMAQRITKKATIVLSAGIHPFYRQVASTYLLPTGCEIRELPVLPSGRTDLSPLEKADHPAALALQSPNVFGCVEDLPAASAAAAECEALLAATFTEPLAFGLYRSPGESGADIVCGEGQSLGIPRSFGGPGLGIFAGRSRHVRSMPGRLVGKTSDRAGNDGFVLTLATREQHIRRERATSNICTNSSLCALSTVIYLALLGGTGFRTLARLNYDKAEYLKQGLRESGWDIPFSAPSFNEFVVAVPGDGPATHRRLREKNILAGVPLSSWYPGMDNHYLLCVTETCTREEMDRFISEVRQ